ncbi:hypothetical protein VTN77DRAFT_912 [Rasamsonia byssochlamydoides]|uniref:uncharacterized protein n=1 Tax=Rasamsonia byssochlamydoides TaxID=89139 RepID=UPI003743B2FE
MTDLTKSVRVGLLMKTSCWTPLRMRFSREVISLTGTPAIYSLNLGLILSWSYGAPLPLYSTTVYQQGDIHKRS